MHYYKRNIGDYHKKAGRLSMLEHGAYTLLIDSCYDRERFPTLEDAIEWTWARSDEEIAAVRFVLGKFFTLVGGVYVQQRIQDELDKYHENSETNARIAREREEARRTKRERSVNEPPPNQEPLTKNQEPNNKNLLSSQDEKPPVNDRIPYEEIKKLYHEILPCCPKVAILTSARKSQIAARWKSGVLPDLPTWKNYFEFVSRSDWLTGKCDPSPGRKRFVANLEWLTKESNFVKVWEKTYHGKG